MNGRNNKIKSWLQIIYNDINITKDIFTTDMITSDDIGDDNYVNIINKLNDVSICIEDILFLLENKQVVR